MTELRIREHFDHYTVEANQQGEWKDLFNRRFLSRDWAEIYIAVLVNKTKLYTYNSKFVPYAEPILN
jgi:hypothetical protein